MEEHAQDLCVPGVWCAPRGGRSMRPRILPAVSGLATQMGCSTFITRLVRLPAICPYRDYVETGGLMAPGPAPGWAKLATRPRPTVSRNATIGIVVSGLRINTHGPSDKITSGFERSTSRANSTVGCSTEYRSTIRLRPSIYPNRRSSWKNARTYGKLLVSVSSAIGIAIVT